MGNNDMMMMTDSLLDLPYRGPFLANTNFTVRTNSTGNIGGQRSKAGIRPAISNSTLPETSSPTLVLSKHHHQQQREQLHQHQHQHRPPQDTGLNVVRQFRNVRLGVADDKRQTLATRSAGANDAPMTKPYRPTIAAYQRKYPKVLFYVHIHKSAGTLFCRLAFKNRIHTKRESNCNVQDDQYCCGGKDTVQAQITFANLTYWDLVATERELYESMAPDYYDYIVTLRDSKSRYASHYRHLRRLMPIGPGLQLGGFGDSAWIYGNNNSIVRRTMMNRRPVPEGVDPLGSFDDWIRGQPDNWNTRILCGAKCRSCPKYQITRELFDYTLQRANDFKHFLFVEDIESSYNQIANAYNWRNSTELAHVFAMENKSIQRNNDSHQVADPRRANDESWDPFMSALDDALYEFAQRKYHQGNGTAAAVGAPFRNQNVLDRYFEEGTRRGCLDACCGNCTPY